MVRETVPCPIREATQLILLVRVPHNTHIDHIARGGCWEDGPAICRSAFRKHYPGFKGRFIGFRVALVKLPVLPALPPAPAVASTQQT